MGTHMRLRRSFFNLYHSISTMEYRMNSRHSGDLSYRDILYINMIMFMDDCTVSKLAKIMNITKPAVTVRINHLIEEGVIIKQKSKSDKRVNILIVSPMIYSMYGSEDKTINHALNKIREEYTSEEIAKFVEMLDSLSHNLVDEEYKV